MDIIETNSAAKTDWKNDEILKLGIISANPSKTAPFMMGITSPKDTTASGRVSIKMIGLMNIFINVSKTVVIIRASKVTNENPLKRALVIQREVPVAIRFIKFAITFVAMVKV